MTIEKRHTGRQLPDVIVPDPARAFRSLCASLYRFHLLDPVRPSELDSYVGAAFDPGILQYTLQVMMQQAGFSAPVAVETALKRYVGSPRWPGWVLEGSTERLPRAIVEALRTAGKPLTLPELASSLPSVGLTRLRQSLDWLAARLALFEDLRPQTWEVVFGLLPAVDEGLRRGEVKRIRPELQLCETPRELVADGGWLVNALRARPPGDRGGAASRQAGRCHLSKGAAATGDCHRADSSVPVHPFQCADRRARLADDPLGCFLRFHPHRQRAEGAAASAVGAGAQMAGCGDWGPVRCPLQDIARIPGRDHDDGLIDYLATRRQGLHWRGCACGLDRISRSVANPLVESES